MNSYLIQEGPSNSFLELHPTVIITEMRLHVALWSHKWTLSQHWLVTTLNDYGNYFLHHAQCIIRVSLQSLNTLIEQWVSGLTKCCYDCSEVTLNLLCDCSYLSISEPSGTTKTSDNAWWGEDFFLNFHKRLVDLKVEVFVLPLFMNVFHLGHLRACFWVGYSESNLGSFHSPPQMEQ